MYRLKYRHKARNYLAHLPLRIKTGIVEKLHELCSNPDSPSLDIDSLKGREGFRLRVGQYRIICTREDYNLIIEVVRIRTRGDIYETFEKRPLLANLGVRLKFQSSKY